MDASDTKSRSTLRLPTKTLGCVDVDSAEESAPHATAMLTNSSAFISRAAFLLASRSASTKSKVNFNIGG